MILPWLSLMLFVLAFSYSDRIAKVMVIYIMKSTILITYFLMFFSIQGVTAVPLFKTNDMKSKDIEDTNSQQTYWTLERMKNAKPLAKHFIDKLPLNRIEEDKLSHDTVISRNGMPPEGEKQIINTEITNSSFLTPFKTGVSKLITPTRSYYTSSRLIPSTANKKYPFSTVGKLFFTIPQQGDFFCSASVINYRIVLTAGHCVHDGSNSTNGFFTNFSFVPAYRDGVAPLFIWRVNHVVVTTTWYQSRGILPNGADYAMIEVDDQPSDTLHRLGSDTGFLGYQINSLRFNHATILGYPQNIDQGEQMHQVTAGNAGSVSNHVVAYGSDMKDGADGGPFVQNFGKRSIGQKDGLRPGLNQVIGVASFFASTNNNLEMSSIIDSRFDHLFNKICAHRVGNCA